MKRMLFVAAASLAALGAFAQEDPDRKKTANTLYLEGLKLETEKPVDLQKSIGKYKKAVDRAGQELNDAKDDEAKKKIRWTAAAALMGTGRCNEKLEPENVAEAQAAYGKIAADFADVEKLGDMAKEKAALKGVDVYLRQLHAALRPWRDTAARSPIELAEKKKAAWDKIQPLDKDAVAGLIWGLGHDDEVIRDFAGEKLAEVVDEPGIAAVIGKLTDAKARAGASNALQKVFKKYNEAAEMDKLANDLLTDIDVPIPPGGKAEPSVAKLKPRADDHKKKAAEIRHNVPDKLDGPQIQQELAKIISDENADTQARLEAASAVGSIGLVKGALADALVAGMESKKNRSVRAACCRAAGAVDTSVSQDKHKIADKLIQIVQYEPQKEVDKGEVDWNNDEVVRQAAAEALGKISLVKSLPALIEALDDNDARVRQAAHHALKEITNKDFGYEPDLPLKDRQEAQKKWQEWWTSTEGIVVLVERFWVFQSQWKEYNAVKLFDPEAFLRDVEARAWASADAKSDMDRAKRVVEKFQNMKNVFVQDAVDIGAAAIDKLLKFIGGETDKDGGKANAPTRLFVAEACAKIIATHNVADGPGKLRDAVRQGDSAAKKAGGAAALGFLPKDKAGDGEREALQTAGLGAGEADIREASAWALGRVGVETSASDLTKAAVDSDVNVQVAALRSIGLIAPKNAGDTIKVLGDLVADEPDVTAGAAPKKSANGNVRISATDALGNIGDPAAMPALIRAARDTTRGVREAASVAIRKVYKSNAQATTEEAIKVLRDDKRKTDDRIGAALALGNTGDAKQAKALVSLLVDMNPPRVLRDPDPAVRIAICKAIEMLKAKNKTVVEKLLYSMADESEREHVRNAAYGALKACAEKDLDNGKFDAADPKDKREPAIKAWTEWYNSEGKSFPDEA